MKPLGPLIVAPRLLFSPLTRFLSEFRSSRWKRHFPALKSNYWSSNVLAVGAVSDSGSTWSRWAKIETVHPGISLHRSPPPHELQLMRLSLFVAEMKIPTIPQEEINRRSPEIRPSTEQQETPEIPNCNYYFQRLTTFSFLFTALVSSLIVMESRPCRSDWGR